MHHRCRPPVAGEFSSVSIHAVRQTNRTVRMRPSNTTASEQLAVAIGRTAYEIKVRIAVDVSQGERTRASSCVLRNGADALCEGKPAVARVDMEPVGR